VWVNLINFPNYCLKRQAFDDIEIEKKAFNSQTLLTLRRKNVEGKTGK
jgi:hypothetical protein